MPNVVRLALERHAAANPQRNIFSVRGKPFCDPLPRPLHKILGLGPGHMAGHGHDRSGRVTVEPQDKPCCLRVIPECDGKNNLADFDRRWRV
jgi:hypothetical protein